MLRTKIISWGRLGSLLAVLLVTFSHCTSSDCPEIGGLSGEEVTYYPDRDNDGFTLNLPELVCPGGVPPEGYTSNKSEVEDCNDACLNCSPGKQEICDGEDNDCDGSSDEGLDEEDCSPCALYCVDMQNNCSGNLKTYNNINECLVVCAAFPQEGEEGVDENSVQCRARYAELAKDDPVRNCPPAGITGGTGDPTEPSCGNLCDAYCQQVMSHCTDMNAQYPHDEACHASCSELPQNGDFNAFGGDSIQCRTRHGSYPAGLDPNTHCPHSGFSGAGVCGNRG